MLAASMKIGTADITAKTDRETIISKAI